MVEPPSGGQLLRLYVARVWKAHRILMGWFLTLVVMVTQLRLIFPLSVDLCVWAHSAVYSVCKIRYERNLKIIATPSKRIQAVLGTAVYPHTLT